MIKRNRSGFTLIEMIGVLAVISILAALVAPKIFKVIGDSSTTRMAAEVRAYQTAVADWFKDVGDLRGLTAAGAFQATTANFSGQLMANGGTTATSGLWARWQGPYIDTVTNPIGTAYNSGTPASGNHIESQAGATGTAAPATGTNSWDLNGDNKNDVAGTTVVTLELVGATLGQAEDVDRIIDGGLSATQGKVKYVAASGLYDISIYLAHN